MIEIDKIQFNLKFHVQKKGNMSSISSTLKNMSSYKVLSTLYNDPLVVTAFRPHFGMILLFSLSSYMK